MFALLRRPAAEPPPSPAANDAAEPPAAAFFGLMCRHASAVGRVAADVRGAIDDALKMAAAQASALQALAVQVQEVTQAQGRIGEHTRESLQAVGHADAAVQAVGEEVGAIVETLRQVGDAAGQITQIALQTRLVAFNASVEAKRAGEAGRGFGVVADAVKDLAAKVEASSKQIMGTIGQLDRRVATLARDIQTRRGDTGGGGAVHQALSAVQQRVGHIDDAARQSEQVCAALGQRMGVLEADTRRTTGQLEASHRRTETFLRISEQMIEAVADGGFETADTPYIHAAQTAAARISALLEGALAAGEISPAALFDERYQAIDGSAPAQHLTRFVDLAERLFPGVQEEVLQFSDKVVFCIAADRNGYIACHNRVYNQRQRPGELVWNTAHCRNRRIFDDRTGLASARSQRPFLLQTYRRDMGGGNFVVMKEAAAPIVVDGRHWGGLRLAFRF
jgi:methyl-accepting chemotaxis protein